MLWLQLSNPGDRFRLFLTDLMVRADLYVVKGFFCCCCMHYCFIYKKCYLTTLKKIVQMGLNNKQLFIKELSKLSTNWFHSSLCNRNNKLLSKDLLGQRLLTWLEAAIIEMTWCLLIKGCLVCHLIKSDFKQKSEVIAFLYCINVRGYPKCCPWWNKRQ